MSNHISIEEYDIKTVFYSYPEQYLVFFQEVICIRNVFKQYRLNLYLIRMYILYIYIYIYVCVYLYVCICVYIHIIKHLQCKFFNIVAYNQFWADRGSSISVNQRIASRDRTEKRATWIRVRVSWLKACPYPMTRQLSLSAVSSVAS